MNVFIDANIFLSFYKFTKDDLEELKKLVVLIEQREIKLFLPSQVIQEVRRNRERILANSLKTLRDQKLILQFPQFCKEYEEYEKLQDLQKEYSKVHKRLIDKITRDIQEKNLKADKIIKDLFELAEELSTDGAIFERARRRLEKGNPPGKTKSIGDALVWESLLENVPDSENLYFISSDKDFCSPINSDEFNGFLLEEWESRKKSTILYYKNLTSFFQEHFPKIHLASELEKDILIRKLANSSSFSMTHEIIAKLNRYSEYTREQINAIVEASVSNNQIYWIICDEDIKEFLQKVIQDKEDQIDPRNLKKLHSYMRNCPDDLEDDDDLPF